MVPKSKNSNKDQIDKITTSITSALMSKLAGSKCKTGLLFAAVVTDSQRFTKSAPRLLMRSRN